MFQGRGPGMPSEPPLGEPPQGRPGRHDGQAAPSAGRSVFYKTRMCFMWQKGTCADGDNCKYAHGEHDLRPVAPEALEIARKMEERRSHQADLGRQQGGGGEGDRPKGWKTNMCHNFMNTGTCSYGNNCKYAHGYEEMHRGGQSGGTGMLQGPPGPGPGSGPPRHVDMEPPLGMDPGRGGPLGHGPDMGHHMPGSYAPNGPHTGFHDGPPPMPHQMSRPMHPGMGAPPPGPPPISTIVRPLTPSRPMAMSPAAPAAAAAAAPPKSTSTEVAFVDRVRAVCGLLNIGNAAAVTKPAAVQHAIATINNGSAFRENPFADSVEHLIPQSS